VFPTRNGCEWASTARGIFARNATCSAWIFTASGHHLKFQRPWRLRRTRSTAGSRDTTLGGLARIFTGFDQAFRCKLYPAHGRSQSVHARKSGHCLGLSMRAASSSFFEHTQPLARAPPMAHWSQVAASLRERRRRVLGESCPHRGRRPYRVFPFWGQESPWSRQNNRSHIFDDVILATHSDQALRLVRERVRRTSPSCCARPLSSNTIYLAPRIRPLIAVPPTPVASWNVIKQEQWSTSAFLWMKPPAGLDDSSSASSSREPGNGPRVRISLPPVRLRPSASSGPPPPKAAVRAAGSVFQGQGRALGSPGRMGWAGASMRDGLQIRPPLGGSLSLGTRLPWDAKDVDNSTARRAKLRSWKLQQRSSRLTAPAFSLWKGQDGTCALRAVSSGALPIAYPDCIDH